MQQDYRDKYSNDIIEAVTAGQKINAIKRLREQTGMGLKEAKHAIEALEAELRADSSIAPQMQEEGGTVDLLRLIVIVAALVAIYWFFLRG